MTVSWKDGEVLRGVGKCFEMRLGEVGEDEMKLGAKSDHVEWTT